MQKSAWLPKHVANTLRQPRHMMCNLQCLTTEVCQQIFHKCDAASAVRLSATNKKLRAIGLATANWRQKHISAHCSPILFHEPVVEHGFYCTDYDTDDMCEDRCHGKYVHGYVSVCIDENVIIHVVRKFPDISTQELQTGLQMTEKGIEQVFGSICARYTETANAANSSWRRRLRPKLFFLSMDPEGSTLDDFTCFFAKTIQALRDSIDQTLCKMPSFVTSLGQLERRGEYSKLFPACPDSVYVDVQISIHCKELEQRELMPNKRGPEYPVDWNDHWKKIPMFNRINTSLWSKDIRTAFPRGNHYVFRVPKPRHN